MKGYMKKYNTELETKCTENTYKWNSFNCNAYDSGYCYVLGRALTRKKTRYVKTIAFCVSEKRKLIYFIEKTSRCMIELSV